MGSAPSKPTATPSTIESEKRLLNEATASLASLSLSPKSNDGTLTLTNLASWEAEVSSSSKTTLTRNILSHSNISTTLTTRAGLVRDVHVFNTPIDFKAGPVTSQKSSGRCWIFASTNVMRYDIMRKLNLEDFQLSQAYLYFYDKLNKANYYLENVIDLVDTPSDDRVVSFLNDDIIADGGQWDMVVNLVASYGVVPQSLFPETLHSSLSGPVNTLLKTKLREHFLILRQMHTELRVQSFSQQAIVASLRAKKEELMKEIYTVMTATLGVPPNPDEKFEWDYYDSNGKAGHWEGTPKDFFNAFATKPYSPIDSFSLINDPRNPYSTLYTVDRLGNVFGGKPVLYVNTEIDNLKSTVVKMIKAGVPVFFGCDIGKFTDSATGIMDPALFDFETPFDIKLGLSKADRLVTGESAMTHAMVISAVHLDVDGNPVRFKVENSWGADAGNKGYFVMTSAWFDLFVYQIVVPRALAPKNLTKIFDSGNAVVLPCYDPMGSLA